VFTGGFAPQCFKAIVTSATIDSLYEQCVEDDSIEIFDAVEKTRKVLARAPLVKSAANLQRSLWDQFKTAHIGWRDLWEPSPHQRVMNAVSTGSRELGYIKELEDARDGLDSMRQTMTKAATMRKMSTARKMLTGESH